MASAKKISMAPARRRSAQPAVCVHVSHKFHLQGFTLIHLCFLLVASRNMDRWPFFICLVPMQCVLNTTGLTTIYVVPLIMDALLQPLERPMNQCIAKSTVWIICSSVFGFAWHCFSVCWEPALSRWPAMST